MITLKLEDRRGTVEPELFGYLIENYGTLLDGIWVGDDPDVPNDDGLRLDTIKVFREIGMQVIRFPGGTPADYYRWHDGTASPLTKTLHAPHCSSPQPNRTAVKPSSFLRTVRRGVDPGEWIFFS